MSKAYLDEIERRLSKLEKAMPALSKSARSSRLLTKLIRSATAILGAVVAVLGLWNAIQPGNQVLSGISAAVGLIITYLNTQFNPTNARARVVRVNMLIDDIEQLTERICFRMKAETEQLKDEASGKQLLKEVEEEENKLKDRIRGITTREI
jgi:glycine cleavage system regulatory protein